MDCLRLRAFDTSVVVDQRNQLVTISALHSDRAEVILGEVGRDPASAKQVTKIVYNFSMSLSHTTD